ncbi:transporter [Burkholderia sp. ABCPW 11]|uniref:transporter n=1 Tax=Burkholderia sp. ABCPW 11 TaxID=1637859 RepID=UPI000B243B7D|nr:transporter [Burkholderia sp. ABCPW 11]
MSNTSYRALLAKRGFAGLLLAVSVGRLTSGLLPFGLAALFVQGASYLAAGVVAVCFMFVTSITAPWRGRYIDRHGARRTLPFFSIASIVLIATGFAVIHYSQIKLAGAAIVSVGASLTPINSVVLRSIWSRVAPDEAQRKALHALDSLLEEGIYMLTPLMVSVIWFFAGPDWAILLACCSIGAGTFLLFWFGKIAGVDALFDEKHGVRSTSSNLAKMKAPVIFTRPGLSIAIPMFAFALTMGIGTIAYAAWSSAHYTTSLTGIFASLSSAGGLVGGLVYGKAKISDSTASRLYFTMPAFVGLCTVPMLLTTSATIAGCVALVSGLVMTPMFIAAYVRVPLTFGKRHFNEANASIGAAYNIGSGLGSLLAGAIIQHGQFRTAFACSVFVPIVASFVGAMISKSGDQPVEEALHE